MTRGPSKQFDREEVLEKAMELFWAQGYEATGLAQLVEHMGIGRQSLYDTFGDKRSLFLEALSHYFQTGSALVREQLRAPGSPLGNLRKVLERLEQRTCESDYCGCLVGNSMAELAHTDPEIAEVLKSYIGQMEDAWHRVLVRAKEAGELASDLPARDLARMMITTFQGVALLSKVTRDFSVLRTSLALMEGR